MTDEQIFDTMVRKIAEAEVARQWPDLKPEYVEHNVRIMTSDPDIVRHARLALQVLNELGLKNTR